jgi:DNA-binding NtrC family response regulator
MQDGQSTINGLRILLVDDDAYILMFFSELLADLGHRVTAVRNAGDAREAVSRESYDIVFLDQLLGAVRGLDLMRDLMARDPGLYCVVMTGSGSTDLAVESLRRGAADFLAKPFFEPDVVRSIGFVVRKRDLDRQEQKERAAGPLSSRSRAVRTSGNGHPAPAS